MGIFTYTNNDSTVSNSAVYIVSNLTIGVPMNVWVRESDLVPGHPSTSNGWRIDLHMEYPYYYEIFGDVMPVDQPIGTRYWWAEQGESLTTNTP